MSTRRNQELAADLARRAIAAAERRRENGEDVAAKLREAADASGRLTVEDAVAALGEQDRRPWDPFAADAERREAKRRAEFERLFGSSSEEPPPATAPQGSADAGQGTDGTEGATYDTTDDGQRFRVYTDAELGLPDERNA